MHTHSTHSHKWALTRTHVMRSGGREAERERRAQHTERAGEPEQMRVSARESEVTAAGA